MRGTRPGASRWRRWPCPELRSAHPRPVGVRRGGTAERGRMVPSTGRIREALMDVVDISSTPQWDAVADKADRLRDMHLRQLFEKDDDRAARMTAEAAGLLVDYSKHR